VPGADGLVASYMRLRAGTASFRGVLRATPDSAPRWTCPDDHLSTASARRCAEAELERRNQGGREVFTLRRCGPCDAWYPDGPGSPCPVCSVPMERVKLVVLERTRVP
jgi:hypothetical protein